MFLSDMDKMHFLSGKKIFVTGASGFIGGHLVKRLVTLGVNVVALVRERSNLREVNNLSSVQFVVGDIRNPDTFASYLQDIDFVCHLAGVVTDWAPSQLYQEVN